MLSVGAPGGLFGLFGAFAWTSLRLRPLLPLALRQPLRWWVAVVAVNVALALALTHVEFGAHVAGTDDAPRVARAVLVDRRAGPDAVGALARACAAGCRAFP